MPNSLTPNILYLFVYHPTIQKEYSGLKHLPIIPPATQKLLSKIPSIEIGEVGYLDKAILHDPLYLPSFATSVRQTIGPSLIQNNECLRNSVARLFIKMNHRYPELVKEYKSTIDAFLEKYKDEWLFFLENPFTVAVPENSMDISIQIT